MNYPFTPCLHPRAVFNSYTREQMVVSCGHCKACLLRKSSRYTSMSRLEASSHSYTYFVTLTYSNHYLPKAYFVPNGKNYDLVDVDSGEVLCADMVLSDDYLYKLRCKLSTDYLPYLNKYDLQLFLKRLRKYYGKVKLRFHAVGEYGPKHFRPHYHLLLWFEDETLKTDLPKIISEKWPFGRVDVQLAEGDAARYVSGYANSFSFVPSVLKQASLSPFCVHSQRLGYAALTRMLPEVYEVPVRDFIERSVPLNGSYKKLFVWRSYTSFFFPKCRGFAYQTTSQRLERYKILEYCRHYWHKESLSELADMLFRYCNEYHSSSIEPEMQRIVDLVIDIFPSRWEPVEDAETAEYVRNVIYRDLLVSSHFYYLLETYRNSFEKHVGIYSGQFLSCDKVLLNKIEKFYRDLDYQNLCSSLSAQESYFVENSIDDLSLFYSPLEQEHKVLHTLAYRRYEQQVEQRFDDSIKHKFQNDVNRILFNE